MGTDFCLTDRCIILLYLDMQKEEKWELKTRLHCGSPNPGPILTSGTVLGGRPVTPKDHFLLCNRGHLTEPAGPRLRDVCSPPVCSSLSRPCPSSFLLEPQMACLEVRLSNNERQPVTSRGVPQWYCECYYRYLAAS